MNKHKMNPDPDIHLMTSIDNVRKFWNDRPCNIRHSKKDIGTKEYFDEVEKKKFFVEPHIKTFSQFNEWNGKSFRNRMWISNCRN